MNAGIGKNDLDLMNASISQKHNMYKLLLLKEENEGKVNLRRILNLKSPDAVQMFWQHVPKASKKVEVKLQMLSDDGVIIFDKRCKLE